VHFWSHPTTKVTECYTVGSVLGRMEDIDQRLRLSASEGHFPPDVPPDVSPAGHFPARFRPTLRIKHNFTLQDHSNINRHDNVYGAIITAQPLGEFTRFIWLMNAEQSVIIVSCAGITLLLSMTVFQLIIADKVPESSQALPLLGTMIIVMDLHNVNNNSLIRPLLRPTAHAVSVFIGPPSEIGCPVLNVTAACRWTFHCTNDVNGTKVSRARPRNYHIIWLDVPSSTLRYGWQLKVKEQKVRLKRRMKCWEFDFSSHAVTDAGLYVLPGLRQRQSPELQTVKTKTVTPVSRPRPRPLSQSVQLSPFGFTLLDITIRDYWIVNRIIWLMLISFNQSINHLFKPDTKSKHAKNKTIKDVKCFGQRRAQASYTWPTTTNFISVRLSSFYWLLFSVF